MANVTLQVGRQTQAIEVHASELRVNAAQPTLQGVLNANNDSFQIGEDIAIDTVWD
jgi:hypothetical protein